MKKNKSAPAKQKQNQSSIKNDFFLMSPAEWVLCLSPLLITLWVWISSLAFVPVPWPDDSAFYFVAKDLFQWPPRWIMSSQAPFEPSYNTFNFNTMPLFPVLMGLGRLIGIDGSFGIKFWSLIPWGLSGSVLSLVLLKKGLNFWLSLLAGLVIALDPALRWASVIVRPESFIGLFGLLLCLGLTFGFPHRLRERSLWDPVSALLALSAYTHFNAIHLVLPVVIAYRNNPKRILQVGIITSLYLSPWILTVLLHWDLFITQMSTQWQRLAVPNPWLSSLSSTIQGLFQSLGSPEPWPDHLFYGGWAMGWILLLILITFGVSILKRREPTSSALTQNTRIEPALAWFASAVFLFHNKPEVWFTYYIHLSFWTLTLLVIFHLATETPSRTTWLISTNLVGTLVACIALFAEVNLAQANRLGTTQSWNWKTYEDFVSCIDNRLTGLQASLNRSEPLRVWGPTFPDVLIELSRKHPEWRMTRTNDFHHRNHLAIEHGWNVDAMVVTETLNWQEDTISAPWEKHPEVESTWLNWKDYYLNSLWKMPGFKPNRFLCQRGRWQAFILSP